MRFLIFIIFVLSFALSFNTFASIGLNSCGEYAFKGTPQIDDKQMVVIIKEKSKSEIRLVVPLAEQSKITPYLKLTIEGRLTLSKIYHLWKGEVTQLKDIKLTVPDPLHPHKNSFLNLIKSKKCQ